MNAYTLQNVIVLLPAVVVGFTLHEFAHAYASVRLGDRTPIDQGRYTLNPIAHVSLLGLIMVLLVGFGWAKPVQFDRRNFKHPRRDEIIVALAGPAANLLLAVVFALITKVVLIAVPSPELGMFGSSVWARLLLSFIWINIALLVFNLLPIPPLDGSHIVLGAIPDRYGAFKLGFMRYGAVVLLVVVIVSMITPYNILPVGFIARKAFGALSALFF